jgi:hypothetical protein
MLHAEALSIIHPVRKEELCIKAELFEDMARIMSNPAEQCGDLAKTTGSG